MAQIIVHPPQPNQMVINLGEETTITIAIPTRPTDVDLDMDSDAPHSLSIPTTINEGSEGEETRSLLLRVTKGSPAIPLETLDGLTNTEDSLVPTISTISSIPATVPPNTPSAAPTAEEQGLAPSMQTEESDIQVITVKKRWRCPFSKKELFPTLEIQSEPDRPLHWGDRFRVKAADTPPLQPVFRFVGEPRVQANNVLTHIRDDLSIHSPISLRIKRKWFADNIYLPNNNGSLWSLLCCGADTD